MRKPRPLSYTAVEVLSFIRRYKATNGGNAPSMREIAAGVGLASTATASHHLTTLERRGYIRRVPFLSRYIEVIEEAQAVTD